LDSANPDILKEKNVPAAFLSLSERQANPDLVKRIVNDGHEIGNHTYTHPESGVKYRVTFRPGIECYSTPIESLTGRSTIFFRPPYFGDAEADQPEEVVPAFRAQNMGYVVVGLAH